MLLQQQLEEVSPGHLLEDHVDDVTLVEVLEQPEDVAAVLHPPTQRHLVQGQVPGSGNVAVVHHLDRPLLPGLAVPVRPHAAEGPAAQTLAFLRVTFVELSLSSFRSLLLLLGAMLMGVVAIMLMIVMLLLLLVMVLTVVMSLLPLASPVV